MKCNKIIEILLIMMVLALTMSAAYAISDENATSSDDVGDVISIDEDSVADDVNSDDYGGFDDHEITAESVKVPYSNSPIYYSVELKSNGEVAQGEEIELELDGDEDYYYATTDSNGIATFKLPPLGVDTHFVDLNSRYGYSFAEIEVTPIKLTVKAPQKTVTQYMDNYFKISLKNGKNPVKNCKIKLKVFTGDKSKTYKVKTNSKGVAYFNTYALSLGTHKVKISSMNSKYKISKTSKIKVKKLNKKRYVIKTFKLKKYDKTYYKKHGKYTFDVMKWKASYYQELDVMVYSKDHMVNRNAYMTKIFYTVNGKSYTTKWLSGSIDATYHKFQTDFTRNVVKVQVKLFK